MDVTPLVKTGAQIIQSYAGGKFKMSGQTYEDAVIVTSSETRIWKAVTSKSGVNELEEADFQAVFDELSEIDVVLLGSGKNIEFLSVSLRNSFKNNGLSVDVMDTGAACRTYNVLMAEGRRVAAMLFPA